MNTNILYDIYKTTRDNGAADLVIGLAMYKAEHPGIISDVEDRAIREFVGKHGKTLAVAFRKGKAAFQAVVEVLEAQDKEAQEARQ